MAEEVGFEPTVPCSTTVFPPQADPPETNDSEAGKT